MSKLVLVNTRAFAAAADLTALTNKVEIDPKVDVVDVTNYASGGWKEELGSLAGGDISAMGFFESGGNGSTDPTFVDPAMYAALGQVVPWTIAPDTAADGSLAYLTAALVSKYQPLKGDVGSAAGFEATAQSSGKIARGVIAHPPGVARTTNGVGTAYQFGGGLTSAQAVYANLHVVSIAGTASPTLTVRIESDNAVGFPSPVTVGTFTAATAVGGQSLKIPGPFTDDWFRVGWTITGTTPSFLFIVSFGRA